MKEKERRQRAARERKGNVEREKEIMDRRAGDQQKKGRKIEDGRVNRSLRC